MIGGGDRPTGEPFATRSPVFARNGMAATSQPLATGAAVATLRDGGSAVDAAIAANAVLGLVEPTGCGLGGDLFAIVWDGRERRIHGLDGSGRTPRGLDLATLRGRGIELMPPRGPLTVSVPGCVDGWRALHERFGRRPWGELFAPAIDHARDGFPLSPVIAHEWGRGAEALRGGSGFDAVFLPGGAAPRAGDVFRNPALATTLERIAAGGADAFYRGEIAARLDAFCRDEGCFLRAEDLAAHASRWVDPISTTYRGHEVWELPPAGQGLAALQMLNVLEGFDLGALPRNGVEHLHLVIEAKKLAFADRARHYADPEFAAVPVAELSSKSYAARRRALIDPARASEHPAPGTPGVIDEGDTCYLATADGDGMMVSLIQSNFRGFGSGLVDPELGFGLQSRAELLSLDPGHPNVWAPGKRPFHTIIPAFVTRDGQPWLAFGVMGGDMQPQGHVQVLANLIDFGLGLQEAGDAARVHHHGSPGPKGEPGEPGGGIVALEHGIDEAVAAELATRGHRVVRGGGGFGGYQAIAWDRAASVFAGASESRKDGLALGL